MNTPFLIFLSWFLWWWCTWFDDLLIFSTVFNKAKNGISKFYVLLGLCIWIWIMLILTIWPLYFSRSFLDFYNYKWLWLFWWFIVMYLWYSTLKNKWESDWISNNKHIFFISFLWYFLNSTDDVLYNFSIMQTIDLNVIRYYVFGILLWAFTMIIIWIFLNKKIKTYNLYRGILLCMIWIWLIIHSVNLITKL